MATRSGLPRSRRPCIEPVPSQPVVFGPRCETTLTLTPATPVVRLTTLVRLTTFVRPGVVTVVEGPGTVTVWLGPVVVTATVVGRVTVTVVVAPPVVVVVPVVVFAVVDHATPPVAESVSKAAVPTPPRTRAAAIVTTRIFLNSALPVSGPIGRIAPSCRRARLDNILARPALQTSPSRWSDRIYADSGRTMPTAARRAVEELFLAYLRRRYPTVSGRSSGQANEASGRVARGWGGRPGASPRRFPSSRPEVQPTVARAARQVAETDTEKAEGFRRRPLPLAPAVSPGPPGSRVGYPNRQAGNRRQARQLPWRGVKGSRPLVPKGTHLSRGTPISYPGLGGPSALLPWAWRAVSLQQASAAKSRVTITCVARRVTSPRAERFFDLAARPLCLSGWTRAPRNRSALLLQSKSRSAALTLG